MSTDNSSLNSNTPTKKGVESSLKWSEKLGYASGDFASCLYFGIFMNFLAFFYTDVFGISAAAVGTMIFITRTWDWINDPIMGAITDRTNTKMGKFRPWLLWMIPPYMIIGILTFTTFDLSSTGKLVYAYITYTLLTMVYTMINIPYSALLGVMTANSEERTVLASFRFVGAFIGVSFVSGTMLYLVSLFGQGNQQLGYSLTVTLYACMAGLLFFITFKTSRERIKAPKTQKSNLSQDLKALMKNGPWVMMIAISVMTIIWTALRMSTTMHFFKYVSGNEAWGATFLLSNNIASAIIVIFTKQISQFFGGKKRAFLMLNIINAVLLTWFYFIDANNLQMMIANQVLWALVSAPLMPLFWSMIADTADYGAVKLGQRSTGLLFSAGTFSQKIGWSIGPALAMYMLSYHGFTANVDQSPETLEGMRQLMSLIPAGIALLTAGLVFFYKIDNKMEKELEAAVKQMSEDEANA